MLNPESPPEIQAQRWFNAETPPTLKDLKGRVVVLAAFQTHCPGSVKHGIPQAARLTGNFESDEVAVIGLNVPFEEHEKQSPEALQAFIEEHDLEFPIALDKPNGKGLPKTFEAYELQGTPAILIFDRQGRLRRHYLGAVDDLRLGAEIMALAIESRDAPREQSIALERRLAATLVDPNARHEHEGGCCGGHGAHDHGHDHDHGHGHARGEGGCCGGAHHAHDHDHDHAHGEGGCCGGKGQGHGHAHGGDGCCGGKAHAHDHGHDHHAAPAGATGAKGKSAKSGGCGNSDCGCDH